MTSSTHSRSIAVIGAGIVGVSCGLFLQDDGHQVTLVDPRDPGEGTSFGNAGVLSASSVLPIATPGTLKKVPAMLFDRDSPLRLRWRYLPSLAPWLARFMLASRWSRVERHSRSIRALVERAGGAHDTLIQRCGAGELVRSGGWLKLARSRAAFGAATGLERQFLQRCGVPFDVLEGGVIREVEPSIADDVTHALHLTANRRVTSPIAYTRRLVETFFEGGGRHLRAKVLGLDLLGGAHGIVTEDDRHPFDVIVIAAGAFSRGLAADAGHRVPLDTERGYHVTLPMPEIAPQYTLQALERGFVMAPMLDGLRITSGVELASVDAPPDYRAVRRLVPIARTYVKGLDDRILGEWQGHRPSLPDGLPVLGRSKRHPDVLFAFGHQHIGLTLGPLTGRIIADIVAGRDPGIDLSPYAPDRLFF